MSCTCNIPESERHCDICIAAALSERVKQLDKTSAQAMLIGALTASSLNAPVALADSQFSSSATHDASIQVWPRYAL